MTRIQLGIALSAALLGAAACGGTDPGPLDRVDSFVFLQRAARNEMGDIFQSTSYLPGGRLVTLSPPTAEVITDCTSALFMPKRAAASRLIVTST